MPLEADCAAACENMLPAAESLGLGSCWVFYPLLAFFAPDAGELRAALRIPTGYKPACAAAFGYPAGDRLAGEPRRADTVTWVS